MNRLILLIFLLILFSVSDAQDLNTLNQSDFELINTFIKDKRNGIKLIAEITDHDLKEIKKYVDKGLFIYQMVDESNDGIADSIKLSLKDKKAITKRFKDLQNFKWTDTFAKKLKLGNVSVISLDSSKSNNLKPAIKYHIVPPIYFQNNQYCILGFSYSCDSLFGHGQITIYKKIATGWIKWDHLVWWDE